MKKNLIRFIIIFSMSMVLFTIVKADGVAAPTIDISGGSMNCAQILGPNLTKLVHFALNTIRIAAAIIAIVQGMLIMIPPIVAKNYDALNKALKKLVYILIILAVIELLPTIIRVIGHLFEYDLSCFL